MPAAKASSIKQFSHRETSAAAGNAGHAITCAFPPWQRLLLRATKSTQRRTHSLIEGKVLPHAKKVTRHHIHFPVVGKALTLAKEAARRQSCSCIIGSALPLNGGPSGTARAPPSVERLYHRPRRPGNIPMYTHPFFGESAAAGQRDRVA